MPRKLSPGFHLRRFKPSFEAVGVVADFVSRVPPFEGYGAGTLITALKYQILNGCHVAGFDGETLIGYCGWLQITKAEGEDWMQGSGELRPAPPSRWRCISFASMNKRRCYPLFAHAEPWKRKSGCSLSAITSPADMPQSAARC
jgi:hypothetical protein